MIAIHDQEYATVRLADLREHPDNPNHGDDRAVLESMDENGFYGAVLVQKSTSILLAGHTRVRVAKSSGLEEIPAILIDVDDETALGILLGDNQTAALAVRDNRALAAALERLRDERGHIRGSGYTDDDDEFIRQQAGLFASDASGFLGGDSGEAYGDEEDDDDPPGPTDDEPTEQPWYQIGYTVTKEQRQIVLDAIKRARSSDPDLTSAEALVSICNTYGKE